MSRFTAAEVLQEAKTCRQMTGDRIAEMLRAFAEMLAEAETNSKWAFLEWRTRAEKAEAEVVRLRDLVTRCRPFIGGCAMTDTIESLRQQLAAEREHRANMEKLATPADFVVEQNKLLREQLAAERERAARQRRFQG